MYNVFDMIVMFVKNCIMNFNHYITQYGHHQNLSFLQIQWTAQASWPVREGDIQFQVNLNYTWDFMWMIPSTLVRIRLWNRSSNTNSNLSHPSTFWERCPTSWESNCFGTNLPMVSSPLLSHRRHLWIILLTLRASQGLHFT